MTSSQTPRISRARFLGGVGLAACGLLSPRMPAAANAAPVAPVAAFTSRPDLQPPDVVVSHGSLPAETYVFVAPLAGPGQYGPLILDGLGGPVWFRPLPQRTIAACFAPGPTAAPASSRGGRGRCKARGGRGST